MNSKLAGMACLVTLSGAAAAGEPVVPAHSVVAAIRLAAERNARQCPSSRRTGDLLTEIYVRAAAAAARQLPQEQGVAGFLIGLGIGLDDSTILRKNPLTAALCQEAESDEERKQRLAVLSSPTMRGRRDLCQHFAVSCALTEIIGARLAEAAGLLKEQRDSQGGSGFSFIDMMANLSGIDLATRLKKSAITLELLEKTFCVVRFVPEIGGLKEDLQAADFAKEFGSFSDKRFLNEMQRLRKRIQKLPRDHDPDRGEADAPR